jgi:hypothetical protein
MATTAQKVTLVSQLGLLEGIKAGLLDGTASAASVAAIAALTTVTTPDGSDPATTQTLANALKVKVNAIIAALKA